MKTAKSISWWVAVFGAWEFLAPFILGYTAIQAAMWDAIIVGIAIAILGIWAAVSNAEDTIKTLNWINAVLGLWLVIAPFLLRYTATASALWNDIIIGIVVIVLGSWAASKVGSTSNTGHEGHTA